MYLLLVTLLGLVTRLILSNQSFWLDEGASIMMARLSLSQLLEGIKMDFHPPIFYALLHYWLPLAGNTDWLIRLPFILLATTTIPAVYYLCREVFGDKSRVPLLSAVFLALNPLHIYYSQELRMYSLVTLLVVLSWHSLLKKNYYWASFFNFLSFFTFYGAVFNIISQTIYLFFNKSKHAFQSVLLITLPTLVIFLFWWPIFSIQLQNGSYLSSILPGWQTLSGTLTFKSLFLIPLKFILGRISFEPQMLYYPVGTSLVFIFSVLAGYSAKNKKSLPIWVAFLTPLIIGTLLSLKTPVLGYWRFLFVLPFLMVLLATGIESVPKVIYWGTVSWICGTFLFFNLFFWANVQFHREDWRGLAKFLSDKKSLVLLAFPYKFAPLNFYETDSIFLPMETESYRQRPFVKADLEEKMTGREVVYYLDYLADLTDPERKGLNSLSKFGLKQTVVYNFNGLGQVYEFRPL